MVDAQPASMGKIGPQHLDKGTKTIALQAFGGKRRDAPALARAVECIGWRAHGQLRQQFILAAPGLTAGTIGTHGQVGDQADGHAAATRRGLGPVQAAGDQPLAKGVITDERLVPLGKPQ